MLKYFTRIFFCKNDAQDIQIQYSDDESNDDIYISNSEVNKDLTDRFGDDATHLKNLKEQEFTSLTTVGSGAFSVIKESYSKRYNEIVGIKIIRLDENISYVNNFLPIELNLWKKLSEHRHENIVNLFQCIKVHNFQYIIMELAKQGNLSEYLLSGPLTEAKGKRMFQDIVVAVKFCHDKNIAHRDIKPENLLIGENSQLKLADFSFVTEKNPVISERCGTPCMLSPEQINGGSYDPFKSDIWQVGLTLYMMLFHQFPFKSTKKKDILTEIKTHKNVYKNIPYPKNKLISVQCKDLISGLLHLDPLDRYSIYDVCNDEWMLR